MKEGLTFDNETIHSFDFKLDDESELNPISEARRYYYQAVIAMHKALKVSGTALGVAFFVLIILFYYLYFDVKILGRWQGIALFCSLLLHSSIFANTLLSLATVIHGKFNQTLQVDTGPDVSKKSMKESLLFIRALCDGSKTSTFWLTVFIFLAVTVSVAFPGSGAQVPEGSLNKIIILTVSYAVATMFSVMYIKLTHGSINEAIDNLPAEDDVEEDEAEED